MIHYIIFSIGLKKFPDDDTNTNKLNERKEKKNDEQRNGILDIS